MPPTAKTLLLLFLAALLFYVISFFAIERRRHRLEPWTVTFSTNANGEFQFAVEHQQLGITNVAIHFSGAEPATNFSVAQIRFLRPREVPFDLPFGECVFMDTTFQPGTVVLRFEGHEVQLLPRVLTIDRREIPWRAGDSIVLEPAGADVSNQPAAGARP